MSMSPAERRLFSESADAMKPNIKAVPKEFSRPLTPLEQTRLDFTKATRLKVSNNATQRRPLSYKAATLGPRYEIDMYVYLGDARRWPRCAPRFDA